MMPKMPTPLLIFAIVMGIILGIVLSTELHKKDCFTIEYRNVETDEVIRTERICTQRESE